MAKSQVCVRTHGLSKTQEYKSWNGLVYRCEHDRSGNYGARGIRVCRRWRNSFLAFLEDMWHAPSPLHSIDRIDVNGNYEPSNCRWATRTQQARNTRSNTYLTHDGHSLTIAEWSEVTGIKPATICTRIYNYGWPIPKALTLPPQKKLPRIKPWTRLGMSRSSWYRMRKTQELTT
jgi:hypothetical protein